MCLLILDIATQAHKRTTRAAKEQISLLPFPPPPQYNTQVLSPPQTLSSWHRQQNRLRPMQLYSPILIITDAITATSAPALIVWVSEWWRYFLYPMAIASPPHTRWAFADLLLLTNASSLLPQYSLVSHSLTLFTCTLQPVSLDLFSRPDLTY